MNELMPRFAAQRLLKNLPPHGYLHLLQADDLQAEQRASKWGERKVRQHPNARSVVVAHGPAPQDLVFGNAVKQERRNKLRVDNRNILGRILISHFPSSLFPLFAFRQSHPVGCGCHITFTEKSRKFLSRLRGACIHRRIDGADRVSSRPLRLAHPFLPARPSSRSRRGSVQALRAEADRRRELHPHVLAVRHLDPEAERWRRVVSEAMGRG